MPTITINLFVSIANAFKAFDINYALTGGGPSKTTQTIAMNIYDDAFGTFNMGYGCAKSVILFLIIAAISLIQLNITRKMRGAVIMTWKKRKFAGTAAMFHIRLLFFHFTWYCGSL